MKYLKNHIINDPKDYSMSVMIVQQINVHIQ